MYGGVLYARFVLSNFRHPKGCVGVMGMCIVHDRLTAGTHVYMLNKLYRGSVFDVMVQQYCTFPITFTNYCSLGQQTDVL